MHGNARISESYQSGRRSTPSALLRFQSSGSGGVHYLLVAATFMQAGSQTANAEMIA